MASTTIIASPLPETLEDAAAREYRSQERQALLDGYEAFRRIKDGYEEAPRPSADDVESVLSVLSSALSPTTGQQAPEAASRGGEWENVLGKTIPGGLFASGQGIGTDEGRSWTLRLSPGVMGLRCADENKKERAEQREEDRARRLADEYAALLLVDEAAAAEFLAAGASQGEIMEWSARSRVRLSEMVGSLDYSDWLQSDGALAMVTLTLPGDWLTVAPDGATFKKLLKRFEMRWRRQVGPWRLLWKLEFQRRGAPHWHALMRVPALVSGMTFEEWLSYTWADVVNHPDPIERMKHEKAGTGVDYSGKDFSDPRRISLYFLGHSAKTTDGKEYQHIVPEEWQKPGKGPGRFWGNPGLKSATREIVISERDAVQAARVLRKVKKARAWTTQVLRERGALDVGQRHLHNTFTTELRQKAGQKRGRSAHRTFNRKLKEAAEAKGQYAGFKIARPRFVPSSLGGGGYAVGGWVLVNDGLQLGVDVARYFELRSAGEVGSPLSAGTDVRSRNDDRPARLAAVRKARQQRLERGCSCLKISCPSPWWPVSSEPSSSCGG